MPAETAASLRLWISCDRGPGISVTMIRRCSMGPDLVGAVDIGCSLVVGLRQVFRADTQLFSAHTRRTTQAWNPGRRTPSPHVPAVVAGSQILVRTYLTLGGMPWSCGAFVTSWPWLTPVQ